MKVEDRWLSLVWSPIDNVTLGQTPRRIDAKIGTGRAGGQEMIKIDLKLDGKPVAAPEPEPTPGKKAQPEKGKQKPPKDRRRDDPGPP